MNKRFLIGLILALCTTALFAKDTMQGGFDYDKFKAEKIALFTDIIELTPAEAQRFWPVYNEYEKLKWELITERREIDRSLKEYTEKMTNSELIELSRKIASFNTKEGELDTRFNEKFLEILSPEKVIKLYMAEIHFRNTMLRSYRSGERRSGDNRQRQ